jgi:hypothetical protein
MRALSGLTGRLAPCFPVKSHTYKAHASCPNQSSRAGSSTWLVQHQRRLSEMLTHALATRSLPLPPQGLQRAGCPPVRALLWLGLAPAGAAPVGSASRPSAIVPQRPGLRNTGGTAHMSPNWPIHIQLQLLGTVTGGSHAASKMGKRAYMQVPVKTWNFGAVF